MNATRTFLIVAATGLAYLVTVPPYRAFTRVRRARAELRRRANERKWERKRSEADQLANRILGVG